MLLSIFKNSLAPQPLTSAVTYEHDREVGGGRELPLSLDWHSTVWPTGTLQWIYSLMYVMRFEMLPVDFSPPRDVVHLKWCGRLGDRSEVSLSQKDRASQRLSFVNSACIKYVRQLSETWWFWLGDITAPSLVSVGPEGSNVHMRWQMHDWKDLGHKPGDEQQPAPDQINRQGHPGRTK